MKKIYAVSDIHGYYDVLISELQEAGYNENDSNHLLIVLGDCFDRGVDSVAIYEYLKRLTDENKAIVIRGNHEEMFENYLNGNDIIPFNYMWNGTNATLDDFTHRTNSFISWCMLDKQIPSPNYNDFAEWIKIARDEINKEYPELLSWINERPYFYETKNYIFTHGMINGSCPNWKLPPEGWREWTWAKPKDFFNPIINTDKTVVVGHINCGTLRQVANDGFEDIPAYTRKDGRVIGLDTCTTLTKKINVLVIEDELL